MYTLPQELRSELKDPFGPITTGPLAEHLGEENFATVGDVVTKDALEEGLVPDLMIVDGKTKRTEQAPALEVPQGTATVRVKNPPAKITRELWEAIEDAYENPEPILIRVEGEEDLATLACIVHAPDDATVVYGQPDEGAVIVTVDQITRERAETLLAHMEVV